MELGAGADARGPAPGHRLQLGVEAHPFGAVHVEVAEERALPAAEAGSFGSFGDTLPNSLPNPTPVAMAHQELSKVSP